MHGSRTARKWPAIARGYLRAFVPLSPRVQASRRNQRGSLIAVQAASARGKNVWRAVWAGLLAVTLTATAVAVPAVAAPGDPQYLTVTKTVSKSQLQPGETFTYTITVNCSEASCLDAALDDALPAELAGYPIQNFATTPSAASIPRTVTWTVDGVPNAVPPTTATADTKLHVDFTGSVTAPTGIGMQNGQTFAASLTLQVPTDLPPGTQNITNTARTAATNSSPAEGSAPITVTVPEVIDVGVSKSWSPSPQNFNPGNPSTIALTASNSSNRPVDKLVLQEPATADDGAAALDASNPFTITDFTGFTGFVLPSGADAVQVDVYVNTGTSWEWQNGTPATTPTLGGIDPGEVGGLRLTFTGPTPGIAKAAVAEISLNVGQRATDRDTGADLSTASHTVANVASGTATVDGIAPVSTTATATYTVNPSNIAVITSKDIIPARIAAGDSADGRIVATNTSDDGVSELRVADLNYFTDQITFGGFTSVPTWPAGAASAVLRYFPLAGGASIDVPFAQGVTPTPPANAISGFEFIFTAPAGGILPASSTTIEFEIKTTESALGSETTLDTTNRVDSTVKAANGVTATANDSADLRLVEPAINVALTKIVRPSAPVAPGETVVTELKATLTTTSDYVTPTKIVVEDSLVSGGSSGTGTFWDAFDLSAIAPTQVPADTSLMIQIRDSGGAWVDASLFAAQTDPFLASLTKAQIVAALGASISTATGVRFTFDNATGFAANTIVTPYVISTARTTLRSGAVDTVPGPEQPTRYVNTATTAAVGQTEAGTNLTAEDDDQGEAFIESHVGGIGPVGISKTWNQATVPAQSQAQRSTTLDWRVSAGYETVTITDPLTPTDPTDSVFEAFDLVGIAGIAANAEPFSNGWYLRYDSIAAINLYDSVAGWETVTPPAGGWIQNGAFMGYQLTVPERESVTGIQIVLEENAVARAAAAQIGANYDPFAPASGTGVAATNSPRSFDLSWQIRNTMRGGGSGAWVTDKKLYNTTDQGIVLNDTSLAAVPLGGGTPALAQDSDTILITNPGPGVTVAKTASPSTDLYVPIPGADSSAYPAASFTLTARNNSVSRASYVRVMDPPTCLDTDLITTCGSAATAAGALVDPFTAGVDWLTAAGQGNPFDRFDLTDVTIAASIPGQIDLSQSTVWLLRYDGVDYTTGATNASAVNAMDAAALADVVGISVTFQGTDPTVSGGTITSANNLTVTMATKLRSTLRHDGSNQTLSANQRQSVPNRVFAQSYDPILSDGTATGARATAALTLTGGDINVAPVKSISPGTLTEPTRNDQVTVTIGANQGTSPVSSLAPAEVSLTDDVTTSPDFWNRFNFSGLGSISAPAGADQVKVGVYGPFGLGGTLAWEYSAPTAIASATVPLLTSQYSQVQGLSIVFSRTDGAFFSPLVPAPAWSTTALFTVQLRDTYRDSDSLLALTGTTPNTVSVVSDRLNGEKSEVKTSAASIALSLGTFRLAVNKLANEGNHFSSAGVSAPWDLSFQNTGTGYLSITELRDLLPPTLTYLGTAQPIYTPDVGGLLPEPQSVQQIGNQLVFSWPDDAQLKPGETFRIRVQLELQPGLSTGGQAVNTMTVSTVENLDICSNIASGGSTTGAWAADDTLCGTTDYLTPTAGANLFTVKGVRGAFPGAQNQSAPEQACTQNLLATGGAYFRAPCAANSAIGGTDDWVLRTVNAGTTGVSEMVIFDQFPVAGDSNLISGTSRGSGYRPQLTGAPSVTMPVGATAVIEVTSDSGACLGTWANLVNQAPCEQNGETWTVADGTTNWSAVRGVRVTLDFSDLASGLLAPGGTIDINYTTVNLPATTTNPDGAPSMVPAADSFAYNQFGVKYRNEGAAGYSKIAPAVVGVHLVVGAIQVGKEVTGPASAYAPAEFRADISCSIEGVDLAMGQSAVLTLTSNNGFSDRIDGIPLGAECSIAEQGELGTFGETTRSGSPVTIAVDEVVTPDADVPSAQVAQISNDYQFSGLSVTKRVQTDATAGQFGPFDFTLSCESATGMPVVFNGATSELTFSLSDGETFTAPADTIPARANCFVSELTSAADDIVVVGTGVTDNGDGSADVVVGVLAAEVQITNSFDSGILTVVKVMDGAGADLYGAGPFTFTATCTYGGQTVLDLQFQLEPNSQRTFGPLPKSTDCVVSETGTGGATRTVIDPEDGRVVIADGAQETATVTATNTFELTSIAVTKRVTGDLTVPGARGQFEVALECVLPSDGTNKAIEIPGGAVRELQMPDRLNATYDRLPVGALCELTETEAQGAFSTVMSVTHGDAEATITNGNAVAVDLSEVSTPTTVLLTNNFVSVLAFTGVVGGPMGTLGLLLLIGGAAILFMRRRRGTGVLES